MRALAFISFGGGRLTLALDLLTREPEDRVDGLPFDPPEGFPADPLDEDPRFGAIASVSLLRERGLIRTRRRNAHEMGTFFRDFQTLMQRRFESDVSGLATEFSVPEEIKQKGKRIELSI